MKSSINFAELCSVILEQCCSDLGSRHSSVGTTSVSDTGSVSDECRNVRPIQYWIPTSFRHRIPTSFQYWIPTSFWYWISISFHYQRTTLIWYRNFKYNKYKQWFSFHNIYLNRISKLIINTNKYKNKLLFPFSISLHFSFLILRLRFVNIITLRKKCYWIKNISYQKHVYHGFKSICYRISNIFIGSCSIFLWINSIHAFGKKCFWFNSIFLSV